MLGRIFILGALIVSKVSFAAEPLKDDPVLLDDSELMNWNISAPKVLLQTKQNIEGSTNVVGVSYLSAELAGISEDKWKLQVYETIKKEMYFQDGDGYHWMAEGILSPKAPVTKTGLVEFCYDKTSREIAAFAHKEYVLAQVAYIDMNRLHKGYQDFAGPYLKKQVYISRDLRSGAITFSFVKESTDKSDTNKYPSVTRFFEIRGDELRFNVDRCSTPDLIYSFANVDSVGNLIMYFGYDGYYTIVVCDKKDILRYLGILGSSSIAGPVSQTGG